MLITEIMRNYAILQTCETSSIPKWTQIMWDSSDQDVIFSNLPCCGAAQVRGQFLHRRSVG
jgi:hypothetical protein